MRNLGVAMGGISKLILLADSAQQEVAAPHVKDPQLSQQRSLRALERPAILAEIPGMAGMHAFVAEAVAFPNLTCLGCRRYALFFLGKADVGEGEKSGKQQAERESLKMAKVHSSLPRRLG